MSARESANSEVLKATPVAKSAVVALYRLDKKLDRLAKDVTATKVEIAAVIQTLLAEARLR